MQGKQKIIIIVVRFVCFVLIPLFISSNRKKRFLITFLIMANTKERDESVILAHRSYEKKDYQVALQHLNELNSLVPGNKRVQFNKSVVELISSDLKNVEPYQQTVCKLLGVNFPDIEIKEQCSPYLVYGYAVLLYHSRYYYQCATILEQLLLFKTDKESKIWPYVVLLLMESTFCRRTYEDLLEFSKQYGKIVKSNNDVNELFERLVIRAEILVDPKNKINLTPNSIENCFIVAQHQYMNGEVNEAANTLGLYKTLKFDYTINSQGEDIWAAINNNLGVIYLSVKKPFLASKYFQHAVKEHFKAMETENSDRLITCRDRSLYVYNLGLALLGTHNTEGAFECLVEAARHYPNNPRVWLHLAECCVKKCCSEEALQLSVKKLGSGPHTRVLITKGGKDKYSTAGESFAIPSLSLEFAALCLRNAITLLPNQDIPADVMVPMIQAPPGPPISWKQRCELKNSTYVLQSYVFLHLQDPLAALVSANELLSQPEASNTHKAWSHIYAAEALINLDRITDAIEHLHPPMIHELVSVLPNPMKDMIAVAVWAKAAVCHILRGDLVTARKILLQINSPKVLPLQMYLEICTGNIDSCHTILRKLRVVNIT